MEKASGQSNQRFITTTQLVVFFLPLAVSSALITASHSLYNAGIARLSQPEMYLAAFAVAKSLYQMIQFPTITSRQCIAGLSMDSHSFLTTRRFFTIIIGLVVLILGVIAFTPISTYIFTTIMGNSPLVTRQATISLRCFFVLPMIFVIRDSYGAVAIRLRQTYILSIGTISRVALAIIIILIITRINVAWDYLIPGVFFLLTGMIETATVFIGTKLGLKGYLKRLDQLPSTSKSQKKLTYIGVSTFALPVLMMAFIQSLTGTFINSGLARTMSPEQAIAAFAVAWTLVLSIDTSSRMFHQVILSFMKDDYSNRAKIRNFGIYVAIVLATLLAVMGFTPLGFWLMNSAIGTSEQLSQMGVTVIRICVALPVMGVFRQYYWGVAMKEHKTFWLTIGSAIQAVTMIFIMILLTMVGTFSSNPAVIGAIAIIGGTVFECIYLWAQRNKSFKYLRNEQGVSNSTI